MPESVQSGREDWSWWDGIEFPEFPNQISREHVWEIERSVEQSKSRHYVYFLPNVQLHNDRVDREENDVSELRESTLECQ
jgi:hypothetical protein